MSLGRRSGRLAQLLALTASALMPALVLADGLDLRGVGARQIAGAGLPLFDDDPFAQAVDVALPGAASTTVAVAWVSGLSGGGLTMQARPASADVPDAVLTTSPEGGWPDAANKPVPTGQLPSLRPTGAPAADPALAIGATFRLHRRLGVGVLAVLPQGAMVNGTLAYTDERGALFGQGPRWARFDGNDRAPAIAMTVGASPWDGFGFAFGAWMSQTTVAEADTYVSTLGSDDPVPIALQTRVETSLAWRMGVRLGGGARRWLAGLSLQQARGLEIESRSRVTIRGFGDAGPELEQRDTGVVGWVPTRVDAFGRWRGEGWRLAAGLTWRDRPSGASALPEPRIAASVAMGAAWEAVAGAAWSFAWQPAQTGRSNWVDNDVVAGSLGVSWRTERSFGTLRIAAGTRLDWLVARTHDKDASTIPDEVPPLVEPATGAPVAGAEGLQTNNPGYPGYRSEGWIVSTSLTVTLQR
ncbi:MAG: hypothetical protein RIT45_2451 [Pseudomonadota bacterium]|jgi:hypothetical protein